MVYTSEGNTEQVGHGAIHTFTSLQMPNAQERNSN